MLSNHVVFKDDEPSFVEEEATDSLLAGPWTSLIFLSAISKINKQQQKLTIYIHIYMGSDISTNI
jgi:hypothetical protein